MLHALWIARSPTLIQRAFSLLPIVYIGLGIIGAVSSVVAVFQALGWVPWPTFNGAISGLWFSPIATGGFLGLTIVALVTVRCWFMIPCALPGLYLAHNRGGAAIAAFGLLAIWFRRPLWLFIILLTFALVLTINMSPSDNERMRIWQAAIMHLTPLGNGFDSFSRVLLQHNGSWTWPQYVHNDFLQLAFEFGIFAAPIFALIAWALSQTAAAEWPIFASFCFMACFAMPVHIPAVAVIGALALITIIARRLLNA